MYLLTVSSSPVSLSPLSSCTPRCAEFHKRPASSSPVALLDLISAVSREPLR